MNRAYTRPVSSLEPADLETILRVALEEDSPSGDITSESIFSPTETCKARLISKEDGVFAGSLAFNVFASLTENAFQYKLLKKDGDSFRKGDLLATLEGNLLVILKIERPLLNMLQYLSGIATSTANLVHQYPGIRILDTRKTIPGYRKLVKYAVHCGGGWNHRLNLSEMAMIKDNHLARAKSISNAVAAIKKKSKVKVELEIDTLDQLEEAISSGAEIILLDNFTLADIKMAVQKIQKSKPDIMIEVSGGITPEKLEALSHMSEIGVSMGYLTHTTRFLDLSLEID